MFLTKAPCSCKTAPPLLSYHPIPILTPFCQTTIFAHLRQRAAGFAIEYSAAFESDRQRRVVATGRRRNTSQQAYTQERGRPSRDADMLTQTHKQKYRCISRIFLHCTFFPFLIIWHLLHLLFSLLLSHSMVAFQVFPLFHICYCDEHHL